MTKMRAVTLLACLALAASAVHAAVEDPCVAEVLKCRDEICANRVVLSNECEFSPGSFVKSCSCGGALEQQQEALGGDDAVIASALGEALEAEFGAEEEAKDPEMDCDEMMTTEGREQAQPQQVEEEVLEEVPQLGEMPLPRLGGGGFSFSFNLGRRFGPQGEQQPQPQQVRFVRPSVSSIFSSGGDGSSSDYAEASPFDAPRLGMGFSGFSSPGASLLDSLFGGARPMQQIPAARQQFLLGAPSFMTQRVFYPDVQSQAQAQSRFQQQPAVTMRLATREELKDLGLVDEDYASNGGAVSSLGEQQQQQQQQEEEQQEQQLELGDLVEAVRPREAVMNALQRWKTAAGVQQGAAMRPMPPVRLTAAAVSGGKMMPIAPEEYTEQEGKGAWYHGYRARRALYCVASIALVMAIIALNAALLMCCASWCCRGFSFGRSDEEGDFTVDSVAATTPLLVEYEVERVQKPGFEHMSEEEMIIVHQMAPMPREAKLAY